MQASLEELSFTWTTSKERVWSLRCAWISLQEDWQVLTSTKTKVDSPRQDLNLSMIRRIWGDYSQVLHWLTRWPFTRNLETQSMQSSLNKWMTKRWKRKPQIRRIAIPKRIVKESANHPQLPITLSNSVIVASLWTKTRLTTRRDSASLLTRSTKTIVASQSSSRHLTIYQRWSAKYSSRFAISWKIRAIR